MLLGRQKKETLRVTGMSCSHCEQTVEHGVSLIAGVTKVKAQADGNTVEVFYKKDAPDMALVKSKIVDLGFEVS